jgi:uncharacterized membrane protein YuzA (DUF378 family)
MEKPRKKGKIKSTILVLIGCIGGIAWIIAGFLKGNPILVIVGIGSMFSGVMHWAWMLKVGLIKPPKPR